MGVIERAFKSIIRQPVKSLILLVTVAVLGTLIAGAVSLKQGLAATQKMISDKIHITASIQLKEDTYTKLNAKDIAQIPFLDDSTVDKITSLSQVKGHEITNDTMLFSTKLISSAIGAGTGKPAPFFIVGAKGGSLLDYEAGNITLTSGRWLTPEDENSTINPIVIADTLASDNRIILGSQITLDSMEFEVVKPDGAYYGLQVPEKKVGENTFTVVGTFSGKDKYILLSTGELYSMSSVNNIYAYTTQNALTSVLNNKTDESKALTKETANIFNLKVTSFNLWLKDRQSADAFIGGVNAMGLPSDYEVVVATETYDNTLSPLKNLDWIMNLIITAAVAATIVVLGLVLTLILKSRRLEIGILFSLGERKKRIAVQMLAEVLIVALIGLSVCVFAGTKLTEGISVQMVKNETENLLQNRTSDNYNYDATVLYEMSNIKDVALSGDTIVWIYLVGLLTAGAASVLPVVFTLRQNPKDILMKGE